MEVTRCRVSYRDSLGLDHATETTGYSAYAAVVEALEVFSYNGLARKMPSPRTMITVTVLKPVVEHTFTLQQVLDALESRNGAESDREVRKRLASRAKRVLNPEPDKAA